MSPRATPPLLKSTALAPPPSIEALGRRYLVRGGDIRVLEGKRDDLRNIKPRAGCPAPRLTRPGQGFQISRRVDVWQRPIEAHRARAGDGEPGGHREIL